MEIILKEADQKYMHFAVKFLDYATRVVDFGTRSNKGRCPTEWLLLFLLHILYYSILKQYFNNIYFYKL